MIGWVIEASKMAQITDRIIVASPDDEILEVALAFGAEPWHTRADHPSGTDRIAEIAESLETDFFVNVQGDEPLVNPESICACAQPLFSDPYTQMASMWSECPEAELDNPSVVKVVTDGANNALYFSRFAVPFERNRRTIPVKKHVGLYAYRRDVVLAFRHWTQSPLELSESLEQLRFLHHGIKIQMSYGAGSEIGVDTPEQADLVRTLLLARRDQASTATEK